MAVMESAQTQPGSGEPPRSGPVRSRARSPWRRWAAVSLAVLVTAALVTLAVLAGSYQPVQFGYEYGGAFPGLPNGTGLRVVNTYGEQAGQLYVPPQPGAFTMRESLYNAGPEAVTIEAVSVLSPPQQALTGNGVPPWPLAPAGRVLGWIEPLHGPTPPARPVAGFTLPPGHAMVIGIPIRLSAACYITGNWSAAPDFYVKERFLIFTHWVAIPFPIPLVFHQPSEPQVPHQDLTCPGR